MTALQCTLRATAEERPHKLPNPSEDKNRRGAVRTALILAAVAFVVYIGFMALTLIGAGN